MFEKFTREARAVVTEAVALAERRRDGRIGTEHVLLAAAEASPQKRWSMSSADSTRTP